MSGILYLAFLGAVLASIGTIIGYFLAPVPIAVITIICICLLAWLFSQESQAEGGLAIVFCVVAVLLFMVPMVIVAVEIPLSSHWQMIKDSTAPVTNFSWSWLFRQR